MEQNRATRFLDQGYGCAESVLLAVCQEFEMETENAAIPRIANAFAGGIGNTGAVCGAVAGAVMAIGLKQDRADNMEGMLRNLAKAAEFRRRFEAEMGAISCRELTGMDMSTEKGLEQFMNSDKPQRVCLPAVGLAYRLVVDLLKETAS